MGFFDDPREDRALERIAGALELFARDYHRTFFVVDFNLFQVEGDNFMAISGVQAGATGTFQIGLVPPNGVPLQSGPSVTTDDATVTLGPIGANLQFTASVPASDTAVSFNVTVSGVNGAGAAVSHTFNVPIIQAPPVQITDFSLDQVS